MSTPLVCRGLGPALEVAGPGRSPLPPAVRDALLAELSYTARVRAAGPHRAGRPRVVAEHRHLGTPDALGRVLAPLGMRTRVEAVAARLGLPLRYAELSPRRPGALAPDWDRLGRSGFGFRPGQEPLFAAVVARLLSGRRDGGVVHVPPGTGKTAGLLPAFALLFPAARILVVVPGRPLLEDAYRIFLPHCPATGRLGGGRREEGRVLVAIANSLHHVPADWADLVLLDEAHSYVGDRQSRRVSGVLGAAAVCGFSATIERSDGLANRLEALCGPVVARMTHAEAEEHGLILPMEVLWVPVDLPGNPAVDAAGRPREGTPRYRHAIWRNAGRNARVAEAARTAAEVGQTLVLVATTEHALELGRLLPGAELAHGRIAEDRLERLRRRGLVPEGFLNPSREAQEDLKRRFQAGLVPLVVATDIWLQGVSVLGLRTVVRADARTSHRVCIQGAGRGTRVSATKVRGLVVDFEDRWDEGFHRAALARSREYREVGWTQHHTPTTRRPAGPSGRGTRC